MARDGQIVTVGTGGNGIRQTMALNRTAPWQPQTLTVFRGYFDLDGSGVGDTADCRITFPMPQNQVCLLNSWHFSIETTGANEFAEAMFELYYAPENVPSGHTTQLNYPMVITQSHLFTSPTRYTNVVFGGRGIVYDNGGSIAGSSPVDVPLSIQETPFRMLTIGERDTSSVDPTLWLSSDTIESVNNGTARFCSTWLSWPYENISEAFMYLGLMNR